MISYTHLQYQMSVYEQWNIKYWKGIHRGTILAFTWRHYATARQSVIGLSPQRLKFDPRTVHVQFVVDKMALRQVLLQVLQFPLSIQFHKCFYTNISFIYHQLYIMLNKMLECLKWLRKPQKTWAKIPKYMPGGLLPELTHLAALTV
jgi:hypothetical protein